MKASQCSSAFYLLCWKPRPQEPWYSDAERLTGRAMDPTPGQRVTSVRRNRQLLACEPCRKSKLRCDHILPSCGRCQRRGIPSQCIYHPAPMTRQKTTETRSSQPTAGANHITSDIGVTFESSAESKKFWRTSFPTPSQSDSLETVSPPAQSAPITLPGYLGPTSYSAVFTENENKFEIASDANGSPNLPMDGLPRITPDQIERGAQALALLSNWPLYERLIDRWYRVTQNLAMIDFMVTAVRKSMADIRDAAMKRPNQKQLRTLSEQISKNTMRPMQVPLGCPVDQFISLFTGEKLRWETFGLYFCLVGQGSMTLQDSDHLDREFKDAFKINDEVLCNIDKRQLANQMISGAEMCASYADQAGNPNDLTVWMLYELTILISIAHGDDSKASSF
jgi:hypothetical protein